MPPFNESSWSKLRLLQHQAKTEISMVLCSRFIIHHSGHKNSRTSKHKIIFDKYSNVISNKYKLLHLVSLVDNSITQDNILHSPETTLSHLAFDSTIFCLPSSVHDRIFLTGQRCALTLSKFFHLSSFSRPVQCYMWLVILLIAKWAAVSLLAGKTWSLLIYVGIQNSNNNQNIASSG